MSRTQTYLFSKDPDSILDYQADWTAWMAADDTIATSIWILPAGLSSDSESHTDTTATIWLAGGTLGEKYSVVNRITTVQGRTEDQTLRFTITEH